MYSFVDTTGSHGSALLPSEALKINGEYIENQISGYRTLYVKGRESMIAEIETYETGIRDGSAMKSRRFPARVITVGYQLIAKSNTDFRNAYNTLNDILNVQDAELIFADEPDKYFVGTPSGAEEVEPGRNAVTGEFEITCLDPFKYSVEEYEISPTLDDGTAFAVDYAGTYKSFPTLEADFYAEEESSSNGETVTELTGNGDCGYVAFFGDRGKIIQVGDPDEEDTEDLEKSQTLINQRFTKPNSWGTAAKSLWTVNGGTTSSSAVVQTGSVAIGKPNNTDDSYYLTPSSYGSGTQQHGPSISRSIPADASGETGATNFTLSYRQKMCIGSEKNDVKQCGAFQVLLTDANKKIIAGVFVYKTGTGKKAKLRFYINGSVVETLEIDLSYHNKYFGSNRSANKEKGIKALTTVKTSSITKQGGKVTFNIGGKKKSYSSIAISNAVVTDITITMTKYAGKTPLSYNGLYWVKFIKNNCDTWRDIPNKFSANDVVVADCKKGEIYLNDAPAPELGALGNDWEEFYLSPGTNQIGISYSDWVTSQYAPTFKMKYREVFL